MKKIVFTMMMAMLTLTGAMAQDGAHKTHEEMTSRMTTKLNLSDEQKTKVAALNKEYKEVFQSDKTQNQKKQTKRTSYEKKLKKILTDDQFKSYQTMQSAKDQKVMKQAKQQPKAKAKAKSKKKAKKQKKCTSSKEKIKKD